jgi:hypothetical protein
VMAVATDRGFEIPPNLPYSLDLAPSDSSCFRNWKPSFTVDVLEAKKVSLRWSMSAMRTKIKSSIWKV